MNLDSEFYTEIIENEKKWLELIDKKFLNTVYCNSVLKPFYIKKKQELDEMLKETNDIGLIRIINVIAGIVDKIDFLYMQYQCSKKTDVKEIIPVLFINKIDTLKEDKTQKTYYKA